ncbi:MAG: CHAT domain-containing protein [Bryobacteraceae bacterium]
MGRWIAAIAVAVAVAAAEPAEPYQEPVEKAIAPDEAHSYTLTTRAGEFIHIKAIQLAGDVAVEWLAPNGARFAIVNVLPYDGYEDLPFIAAEAGQGTVRITGKRNTPATYRLEISRRQPSGQDASLAAGFIATHVEGPELRSRQNAAASRQERARHEFAAAEFEKAAAPRWRAQALIEAAQVEFRFGRSQPALELLERANAICRRLDGERYTLTVTLNGLGVMSTSLGKNRDAIGYLEEALAISRAAKYKPGIATTLNNLGGVYKTLGDLDQAVAVTEEALALRREVGSPREIASTLASLANLSFAARDYDRALEGYAAAMEIHKGLGNRREQGRMDLPLGQTYAMLGELAKARQYWTEAAALTRETGDDSGLASVLYTLGHDRLQTRDYRAAAAYLDEALALHRKTRRSVGIVNTIGLLCRASLELGDIARAADLTAESERLAQESGYASGQAQTLQCRGHVAFARGDEANARELYLRALNAFGDAGMRDDRIAVMLKLASMDRKRGDRLASLAWLEQAVTLTEAGRASIADPELRATYRAVRSESLERLVATLMELHKRDASQGYAERAFNVAERGRARNLTELIAAGPVSQPPAAGKEENRLLFAINAVQRDLFRPGVPAARQNELRAALAKAEREWDLFRAGPGRAFSELPELDACDSNRIRSELLDADSVLLAFSLGDTASHAWAVSPSGVLSAELPARAAIERSVQAYRELISQRASSLTAASSIARIDANGRVLYRTLIAPFERAFAGRKRLIVVPDGVLSYLPFETLQGAGPRLIERFAVSYSPSASALAALRQRRQARPSQSRILLAFADPALPGASTSSPALADLAERGFSFVPLPNARGEVAAIRALFPTPATKAYVGGEAREQAFKTETLDAYRYIHIAAHGFFDEQHPERSGLVLSREGDSESDGVLQAPEIARLRLSADVVTLSACQTGLGRILAGEGVVGLSRAFLHAGAQSLVVSLWNVNDAATAGLMKRFYSGLKGGLDHDEALRRAKLAVMHGGGAWRHPYFWAPFVLAGDYRTAAPE